MRAVTLCCVLAAGWLQAESTSHSDSVILPAKAGEGPVKLLLLLPAGPPAVYLPLAQGLQARSTARLAVGIAACRKFIDVADFTVCDPVIQAPHVLFDAIAKVNASINGALAAGDVFVGGHAAGAVSARHFVDNRLPSAGGVLLLGTQFNGDNDSLLPRPFGAGGHLGYPTDIAAYPRPLLAVAGELDRMPISHLAMMVKRWSSVSTASRHRVLPIIVPGLSASGFCPDFHLPGDLVPEVDAQEGLKAVVEVIGSWMDLVLSGFKDPEAIGTLDKWTATTAPIAAPFTAAMALDQRWCAESQRRFPGVPGGADVQVLHVPFSKLEHCHTQCSRKPGGGLNLTLCDHTALETERGIPSYAGASDVACKMVSEDRVAEVLGLPVPDMSSAQVRNRCQELNQHAWETAKALVKAHWPRALDRFGAQGKRVTFKEDSRTIAGPLWLMQSLRFAETAAEIEVSSTALISPLQSWVYPGNHYCKLLSPSKVVDILMTMGLTHRFPSDVASQMLI